MNASDPRLTCHQCKYLFITHDRNKPWGCSSFGFKSRSLPGQVVRTTSGTICANYSKRASARPQDEPQDKGILA
jgi:hypothetical protein